MGKLLLVFEVRDEAGEVRCIDRGVFAAHGAFGSADGVGGQGCCTEDGTVVIGNQGGSLYRLSLNF